MSQSPTKTNYKETIPQNLTNKQRGLYLFIYIRIRIIIKTTFRHLKKLLLLLLYIHKNNKPYPITHQSIPNHPQINTNYKASHKS